MDGRWMVALIGSALLLGCQTDIERFCDAVCECKDECEDTCVSENETSRDDAVTAGCEAEFDALTACLIEDNEDHCTNQEGCGALENTYKTCRGVQ
jgi:hypothetical protein